MDNIQDKNEVITDESVTPCQPTPQLHNDIDTLPLQNILNQLRNQNQICQL